MNNLESGYKKFLEIYNLKKDLPFFFFFKSQELLRILSSENHKIKKSIFFKNILIFFVNFFFVIISFINIIRLYFTSNDIAHLFIQIKNSDNNYDQRSKHIFEIISPKKTINLVILNDLNAGLKNIFKIPNVIYILQIKKFLQFFIFKNEILNLKEDFKKCSSIPIQGFNSYFEEVIASKKLYNFILILFKFLKIKKIIAIDDPRNINEILYTANLLNIFSIGYQHARFNKYHVGLSGQTFNKYFVWNPYFRDMAKKINQNYSDTNLILTGPTKKILKKKGSFNKIKKIMILDEVYHDNYSKNIIQKLLINNKEIYYLRKKPGENNPINLTKNKIIIDDNNDYFVSLVENEIDLVIGTSSTSLLESWLIDVPSICVLSSNKYASHLYDDGLLELARNVDELSFLIKKYLQLEENLIKNIKKEIWGNSLEFNSYKLNNAIYRKF